MQQITELTLKLIDTFGYPGIFIGLVLDSMGALIPSEVLISGATILAQQGQLNLGVVIVLCTVAQIIGAYFAQLIGRRGGYPLVYKYGKYVLISHRDLKLAHKVFEKYGPIMVLAGRCIPLVRGYIGFVSGVAGMSDRKYMVYSSIGCFAWTLILVGIGLLVANNLEQLEAIFRPFSYAVILLVLVGIIWLIQNRIQEARRHNS